ncbi:HlyD family efflux transporter periplasmic adaptor subunit [Azospira restricta]|uniref:HlyD family efflux transporter periplasmic adaptor subunit n=1 Tax=Azospira restricta TaxID=404405 RepID=UPI001EF00136|nr:HlyD family efflux transporter periplasmic adaptor subunit [Azospira restricta]
MLRRTDERARKLVGYAETDGVLVAARAPVDMPGQYFRKGEVVGYVLEKQDLIARVAVQQDDIDLVRNRYREATLRLAETVGMAHPARLVRVTPGGTNDLPTAALGVAGGGAIPTAPDDREGVKALERIFLLDLQLAPDILPAAFGERVFVRFEHGYEPLGLQGLRRLRQLFLSRFGV